MWLFQSVYWFVIHIFFRDQFHGIWKLLWCKSIYLHLCIDFIYFFASKVLFPLLIPLGSLSNFDHSTHMLLQFRIFLTLNNRLMFLCKFNIILILVQSIWWSILCIWKTCLKCEFWCFFVWSGQKIVIRHTIYRYFLRIYDIGPHLLKSVIKRTNFLNI